MTIQELMEKRAKVWEAAKNFVDTHENENGVLSAEDSATYERMESEIEDLTKAIDRHRKAEEMEKNLNQPVNQPLTGKPYAGGQGEPKTGRASDEYRRAMLNALRSNFRQVSNTLQEGVDADGGYLVPEEYDRRLVDVLNEENIMRRLATRIVTSGEHKINIAATKPAASWIEEGGALTFGDATFDQKILDAHKLHVAIKVTEELLYDNAFNLENYIIVQFGKALANAEEDAFLNGNGTGKPTGIFDGTGGGHLLNTLAAALKSDDMLDLVYGLKRPYRKNASFIMNDATLPSLRKLKDNNGAYIWQPAYQAGEPDRILGYKVETSAYAPKDGIAFGDYSYYNIGDRGNRSFKQLNELFAGNGMIGFVAKERVDGKLVLLEGSAIPCITREVYYGAGSDSYLKTKDPDGKDVFTYWGEGTAMVKWQVAVTYTHSQFWQDFRQESAADTYRALISKLEKGEDATVIFYGDSITFGANASSQIGCEPYAPTWTQMAVQYLAKHYGYTVRYIDPKLSNVARVPEDSRFGERGTITYINTSVGGWTSQNGIDNFNTYVKPYIEQYGCDLFAVAYMNDAGVAPANEKKQIKKITDAVLSVKSDAALMIVATMVPNPNATNGWYGNQHRFETQLLKLASEYRDAGVSCAVMCMTSVSKAVLQHKDFVDYTGNNINHPNDFMVRLYAQTFVQTLVGYENLKAD